VKQSLRKFSPFSYKELLSELVKREIKAKYKQSILGYAWVILVPLINLLVLTLVFSFFIRIPTGDVPYYIFLFTALVPWTYTANAITFATSSLVSNSTLITKIYLPSEVFPLSAIFSKMIDLILSSIILLVFILVSKITIHWTILFVPLIFMVQFLLITGVSLILSALNVFYRDVQNIISVLLTIWMYLTPVVYPQEMVPARFLFIYNLNPMTAIVNSYRNTVLYGVLPPIQSFSYAVLISIGIFIFGYRFFKNKSKHFADVI